MEFVVVNKTNFNEVKKLLKKADLPISDLESSDKLKLYAISDNQKLIAACGLEVYNNEALLRSFVVDEKFRSQGIGKKIYEYTLNQALTNHIRTLVLLTTTAKEWFLQQGWSIIERNSVSDALASSQEFSSICPQSATCMKLNL